MNPDIALAGAFGATGVPFFVIDRGYGVSGAQPVELSLEAPQAACREAAAVDACVRQQGEVGLPLFARRLALVRPGPHDPVDPGGP